jgi:hypothetical protein
MPQVTPHALAKMQIGCEEGAKRARRLGVKAAMCSTVLSTVRAVSANRFAGVSSLAKDLMCARATAEASVDANGPYRGKYCSTGS